MRAKRRSTDSQNLDSLLDTMANVVGILVVLMAVTQLSVHDAMKRIRILEREEVVKVGREGLEAKRTLAAIGALSLPATLDLARIRDLLERLRAVPAAARSQDTAAVAADVASRTLQVRRLEASLHRERAQLADLRIHLSELATRPKPDHIELRLPDPRPAALNSERVVLLCRYGRVVDPGLDALERELFQTMQRATGSVVDYFRRHDVGNAAFRWRVSNRGAVARLDWRRTDNGETVNEAIQPDSAIRTALAGYDPSRHFIRFFVWSDSFDVYLETRRIAEQAGFAVGWEPNEPGADLTFVPNARRSPVPVD